MIKRILLAALAIGAISAPEARAFIITSTDTGTTAGNPAQEVFSEMITSGGSQTSFTTNWFVPAGTSGLPAGEAISGTGLFQVTGFTTTDLTLKITLTNNTVLPAPSNPTFNDARITSFGLAVNPAVATGATLTTPGTVFTQLSTGATFPAFTAVNVCIFSGNNCSGGGNTGLTGNGKSDTFTIDLTGSFGPDLSHLAINLGGLSTKWQGSSPLSFELAGSPGGGGSTPLPEPGTLALLSTGLIGLFFVRRKLAG